MGLPDSTRHVAIKIELPMQGITAKTRWPANYQQSVYPAATIYTMPLDLLNIAKTTRDPADVETWQTAEVGYVERDTRIVVDKLPSELRAVVIDEALCEGMLALVSSRGGSLRLACTRNRQLG
jgi:hypothetical protein